VCKSQFIEMNAISGCHAKAGSAHAHRSFYEAKPGSIYFTAKLFT